jgi:GntR family transcriptional regulator
MRHLVASGVLTVGSAVPSVRDLARELQINPATVSKAYQQLVAQGLLEVRRGDGTYVADAQPTTAADARERSLDEAARQYASTAIGLAVDCREAVGRVEAAWQRLSQPTRPLVEDPT